MSAATAARRHLRISGQVLGHVARRIPDHHRGLVTGDSEHPVRAVSIRGGHIQGSIGVQHRGPEPSESAVEFGYDDLAHKGAVWGELEEA